MGKLTELFSVSERIDKLEKLLSSDGRNMRETMAILQKKQDKLMRMVEELCGNGKEAAEAEAAQLSEKVDYYKNEYETQLMETERYQAINEAQANEIAQYQADQEAMQEELEQLRAAYAETCEELEHSKGVCQKLAANGKAAQKQPEPQLYQERLKSQSQEEYEEEQESQEEQAVQTQQDSQDVQDDQNSQDDGDGQAQKHSDLPQAYEYIPESRLFQLVDEGRSVSKQDLSRFLVKICDTSILDDFFENTDGSAAYYNMYEKYNKNICQCVNEIDGNGNIEDALNAMLRVLHRDLLKEMVVAIYRNLKQGNIDLEMKLLDALNQYLSDNGFYTRNSVAAGKRMTEKDYDDMEFYRDATATGGKQGEITEVELYPYYLNYLKENGAHGTVHTRGSMMVIT